MFEKVRDIIVDTLSCELEDSLDAVELNIALEEQLGLSIADDDRPNMKTVGDIVRYLEALEANKENNNSAI